MKDQIGVVDKLPNPAVRMWIEWRARRIGDPIERLRYLRHAASHPLYVPRPSTKRMLVCGVMAAALVLIPASQQSGAIARGKLPPVLDSRVRAASVTDRPPDVWQVEKQAAYELYSNGLRIENTHAVGNTPRHYGLIDRFEPDAGFKLWRTEPVGIVYHSTESGQAPFEAKQNRALRVMGTSVLEYVRHERAYNFLIDRFGRVHRVVRESDTAYHAGHSVWADGHWVYLNVNASFLGVSFEARTTAGSEQHTLSAAQLRAGKMLTEMLRSVYRIPAVNCVTHAQVSVNPDNMRIGYHTDWAGNFPFAEMGLDDNYGVALPSMYVFGFGYDPSFVKSTGMRLWKGVALAEQEVRQGASAAGLSTGEYQAFLVKRYRKDLAALRMMGAGEEKSDEQRP